MIIDIASWILLLAGSALGIVGGIGIHGFPDFYSRLHAAGITDTLCTMLILLGLGLQAGWSIAAFKLAMPLFTCPVCKKSFADFTYI